MVVDETIIERMRKEAEAGAFSVHVGGRWKFEDAKRYATERMSFVLIAGTQVLTDQRSQGVRGVSR